MKIFVSHAISDKKLIGRLSISLKPYGITLLIAEHSVSMSVSVTTKIEKMINTCDAALILLTKNGFNSSFVQQEIGYLTKAKKPMLKVIEKGFEKKITGFIYGHDFINYDPKNPDDAIKKITNKFNAYYKKIKEKEKEKNTDLLFGFGIGLLVGVLILSPDSND